MATNYTWKTQLRWINGFNIYSLMYIRGGWTLVFAIEITSYLDENIF